VDSDSVGYVGSTVGNGGVRNEWGGASKMVDAIAIRSQMGKPQARLVLYVHEVLHR